MTDYADWKVLKSDLQEKQEEYTAVAYWCNETGEYTIVENELYYEVQAVTPYVPTIKEMQEAVLIIRNQYLKETDFTQLSDAPFTSDEKRQYKEYRKYLRDYTDKEEWWLENPLTFDEWKESN